MTPEFTALLSEYGPIGFEKFVRLQQHLDNQTLRNSAADAAAAVLAQEA